MREHSRQRGSAMLFLACAVAVHLLMQHHAGHAVSEQIAEHHVETPHPLDAAAAHGDHDDVTLACAAILVAAVGMALLMRFHGPQARFGRAGEGTCVPRRSIAWCVRAGPSPTAAGVLLRI